MSTRSRTRAMVVSLFVGLLVSGCTNLSDDPVANANSTGSAPAMSEPAVPDAAAAPSTVAAATSAVPTTVAPTTVAPTTTAAPTTTVAPTTTTTLPTTTPYAVPVADVAAAGWGDTHSAYPATDLFLPCGADIVSPVNGTLLEVRRVNAWDPAVDNPATRGGRSISMLGDDGVRYYFAHFETIEESLEPGDRVTIGQYFGTMGQTGRASACHLHFAISPPCPGKEWSVRRGVIWPYPYLNAWERGEQFSPVAEVQQWLTDNPDACALAMADPNAQDS